MTSLPERYPARTPTQSFARRLLHMAKVIKLSARTKAGRAWIDAVVQAATGFYVQVLDGITGEVSALEKRDVALVSKFVQITGKGAVLYEVSGPARSREYVMVSNGGGSGITRYVIQTYAFDVTDLPEMDVK